MKTYTGAKDELKKKKKKKLNALTLAVGRLNLLWTGGFNSQYLVGIAVESYLAFLWKQTA